MWTYGGTGVSVRDALVPDMSKEWETPGFGKMLPTLAKTGKAKKSGKKGAVAGGAKPGQREGERGSIG